MEKKEKTRIEKWVSKPWRGVNQDPTKMSPILKPLPSSIMTPIERGQLPRYLELPRFEEASPASWGWGGSLSPSLCPNRQKKSVWSRHEATRLPQRPRWKTEAGTKGL